MIFLENIMRDKKFLPLSEITFIGRRSISLYPVVTKFESNRVFRCSWSTGKKLNVILHKEPIRIAPAFLPTIVNQVNIGFNTGEAHS